MTEVEALNEWLAAQQEQPRLHINGADHPTALLTVDWGQPLKGVSLGERSAELTSLMRAAAKTVARRRGPIRVGYDNHHGVYWASQSN